MAQGSAGERPAKPSRAESRTALLLDLATAAGTELQIDGLVRTMGAVLRRIFPHEFMDLMLLDAEQGTLRVHALVKPEGLTGGPLEAGYVFPAAESVHGEVLRERRPFVANTLPEILAAKLRPQERELATRAQLRAACLLPLISRARAVGTVGFLSAREHVFDEQSVELLTQVAGQLAPAIDNALAYARLEALTEQLAKQKSYLEDEIRTEGNFEEIVGKSPRLAKVLADIETVAETDSTVLIQGETGTGKELIARAIHRLSGRKDKTFVKLNCAAIPTGLLESELFGHEKGAFTGAVTRKPGRFELAHQGTLFLDEIGEIAPELQPKLLRVLQDQEFERLGGTKTLEVDVRVVAATNRDLAQMVSAREFRSDLDYRLNVFPISVPPLRERTDDVPLLVRQFVQRFARRLGRAIETIPEDAMRALQGYPWPGNVRELENLIERSVILTRGPTLFVPVGELVRPPAADPTTPTSTLAATPVPVEGGGARSVVDETERQLLLRALQECGWRIGGPKGAAAKLGIGRTTLQSKMERLQITRPGA